MKLTRRDFLTFSGFTILGIAGGKYFKNEILPMESYYLEGDFRQRKEEFLNGICGMCPAGCGIRTRIVDGLPVKIDGNPLCPLSKGRLCPKGQMGLELHYNPDRIASPIRRVGPPGSQQWESLSWDEALEILRKKIKTTVAKNSENSIAVIGRDEQSIGSNLWSRFKLKYPDQCRLIRLNLLRDPAILPALKITMDSSDWPVYDVENSDFLMLFDTPFVSGWSAPTTMISKYASFRQDRDRVRGQMVFVGSRRCMDSVNADMNIMVTPYTSAVLALGMAHVIIREGRYDEPFVSQFCTGFEEMKDTVLKYFKPRMVSEVTGVSIDKINYLAREFAGSSRPIAIGERIPERSSAWEQMAYLTLNALKGSIGVQGGLLFQEKLNLGDIYPPDDNKADPRYPDRFAIEQFQSEISDNSAIPEILLVDNIDPTSMVSAGHSWADSLNRIPFIVSFSPYPDFTTHMADLVLPDLGFLEKSRDLFHGPIIGAPSVAVTESSVKPIGKGMDTRLIQHLLLEDDFINEGRADLKQAENQLKITRENVLHDLFNAGRGMIYDTPFASKWVQRMESGGWWSSDVDSYEQFRDKILRKGGWLDPFVANDTGKNQLLSVSRKFNFSSIVDHLPIDRILSGKTIPSSPDIAGEKWRELTVIPATILSLSALPYGNIPHLLEFPEPGIVAGWAPWLELNPLTAENFGLADEDEVLIEAYNSERKCRVIINDGLHPRIGAIPMAMFGLGEGTWIRDNMEHPLESLAPKAENPVGGVIIKIRKV